MQSVVVRQFTGQRAGRTARRHLSGRSQSHHVHLGVGRSRPISAMRSSCFTTIFSAVAIKSTSSREKRLTTGAPIFPLRPPVKSVTRTNLDFERGFIHHIPAPDPFRRPEGMSVETSATRKLLIWRTRSTSSARTRWRPSSPSRCLPPVASSCPHRVITNVVWRFAGSTTCCTYR